MQLVFCERDIYVHSIQCTLFLLTNVDIITVGENLWGDGGRVPTRFWPGKDEFAVAILPLPPDFESSLPY